MTSRALRALPGVDALVSAAPDLCARYGREATTAAVRRALEAARERIRQEQADAPETAALLRTAAEDLAARRPGPPKPVINAAGVIVHTNLGRAPLSAAARTAALDAAGYCDLEYDLVSGARGSRGARLEPLIAEATGAEAGIAVNNAAGALVLVLAALASERQVLVSRGELVEIGGSFRLPEIMAASGARLVEVGTTNRTRAGDYAAGDDVALILRVHPSNYRVTGFTQSPTMAELATVARERNVPLVHDVGSGLLRDRPEPWFAGEPSMAGTLADGADLALCSGDKLLGGPQAGLLAGRADLVARCRRHPLARALRLDKLRVAALVATLEAHLTGDLTSLPVWSALQADPAGLARRAAVLAARLGGRVEKAATVVGGGAAPGHEIATPVVRLDRAEPERLAAALRAHDPPVIVRVEAGAVWLDLRTVAVEQDDLLARAVEGTAG